MLSEPVELIPHLVFSDEKIQISHVTGVEMTEGLGYLLDVHGQTSFLLKSHVPVGILDTLTKGFE